MGTAAFAFVSRTAGLHSPGLPPNRCQQLLREPPCPARWVARRHKYVADAWRARAGPASARPPRLRIERTMDVFSDMQLLSRRQDGWGPASPASPASSAAPADAGSGSGTAPAPSAGLLPFQQYIAAHAILSMLGFLVLLPIGALVARWVRTHSDRWFRMHWVIQWVLAFPMILAGFALGVASVAKNDRLPLSDTHKRWGVALFGLYLVQLGLGAFIHFVKLPFAQLRGRSAQNYAHAAFGLFIIAVSFYQVRTGFRTEWPLYTGRAVPAGANAAWIVWLVLMITGYSVGLGLLPRQYRQEHAARRRLGYESDSTELVDKRYGQMEG